MGDTPQVLPGPLFLRKHLATSVLALVTGMVPNNKYCIPEQNAVVTMPMSPSTLPGLPTECWLPGPRASRETSDTLAHLGMSRRIHHQSGCQSALDMSGGQVLFHMGRGQQRMDTESPTQFCSSTGKKRIDWKSNSFRESVEKYEATAG